jgi:hypothetical protein
MLEVEFGVGVGLEFHQLRTLLGMRGCLIWSDYESGMRVMGGLLE